MIRGEKDSLTGRNTIIVPCISDCPPWLAPDGAVAFGTGEYTLPKTRASIAWAFGKCKRKFSLVAQPSDHAEHNETAITRAEHHKILTHKELQNTTPVGTRVSQGVSIGVQHKRTYSI